MSECKRIEELENKVTELMHEKEVLKKELNAHSLESAESLAKNMKLLETLKEVTEERDQYREKVGSLKKELRRPLSVYSLLETLSHCGAASVTISLE